MTDEHTQPSDKGTTGAPADTGATTQPSDTGTTNASGAGDSATRTYTAAELESAKRGLIKQQQELAAELEAARLKLREHEEANLSEIDRAKARAEAAEEMARQHQGRIAEMELERKRHDAAEVLRNLNVENAPLIVAAIPDDALGSVESVEAWANQQKLVKQPGGNLPGGKQSTAGNTQGNQNRPYLYRTRS